MNEELAIKMIGKVVLVGITVMEHNGEIIGYEQYYGTILRISEAEGMIILRGDNNEEMWLPPALEEYKAAEPGDYRLKSTGLVVSNPDYLATWNRRAPQSN